MFAWRRCIFYFLLPGETLHNYAHSLRLDDEDLLKILEYLVGGPGHYTSQPSAILS